MASTLPSEARVVVIGAGLAGLQAASTLTSALSSREVVLVEASARIGGRVREAKGLMPWGMNVGPEFIHGGKNSPLVDLIRAAGWRTHEHQWPDLYWFGKENRWEPADTQDPDVARVHELFEDMAKVTVPEDSDISALEWLRREGESERVIALAECIYANDFGTSLRHLGVREMQIEQAAWNQGEEYLVLDRNLSHVASKLAEGVRVVTSWPVAAVRYAQTDGDSKRQWSGGGGCEVRGKDGRVVRCERVVVAVPLNVLKAEDIEFAPPLPEPVRRALGAMAMGNAVKVMLGFESRFWPEELFDVVCTDSYLPEIWTLKPEGFRDQRGEPNYLITGFVAGDAADKMTHTPDEVILQRSLQQLDLMFSTAVSPTPATAAFVRGEVFNWAKEPFVRAAYTYPRVGAAGSREALVRPVGMRVFFAGEHTDLACNPCMQAAMASGSRAAAQVLAAIHAPASRL